MIERTHTKSSDYDGAEADLLRHLNETQIPQAELLENLHLYITPQQLRRIYFMTEVYKKILEVPGVVMQFGVRWGRELALLDSFRTLFESFNHSRRIIGFDTFEGYAGVDEKDGGHSVMKEGNLSTSEGYLGQLEEVLDARTRLDPLSQIQRFDLIKGDVCETLPQYLEENPHTIIAFAHFDLNIYKPTLEALRIAVPHMPRGAIVVIDEVGLPAMPGETLALKEFFDGMGNVRMKRIYPGNSTWQGYFEIE